jgi:hypothetical protein
MIDLTKYKNSRYLKASDLTGQRTRVRIKAVVEEPLGNPPENLIVLMFATDKLKPLVCRYTKLEALVTGLGPDETTWAGKIIDLVKVKVQMQGKMVDSIAIEVLVQPDPSPVATTAAGPPPPPPPPAAPIPAPAASDHVDFT